jgi:hypothetical protein
MGLSVQAQLRFPARPPTPNLRCRPERESDRPVASRSGNHAIRNVVGDAERYSIGACTARIGAVALNVGRLIRIRVRPGLYVGHVPVQPQVVPNLRRTRNHRSAIECRSAHILGATGREVLTSAHEVEVVCDDSSWLRSGPCRAFSLTEISRRRRGRGQNQHGLGAVQRAGGCLAIGSHHH